jgi:hypothetical protein
MKKYTKKPGKKRLHMAITTLSIENQQYVLGVLQALALVQAIQERAGNKSFSKKPVDNQLDERNTEKAKVKI